MGPTSFTRAALAVAAREASRHPDDPALARAVEDRRREHQEARAEQRIRELRADLSAEARTRLAALLAAS